MVSAVLFITFFVLLVLNVPISVCLGWVLAQMTT